MIFCSSLIPTLLLKNSLAVCRRPGIAGWCMLPSGNRERTDMCLPCRVLGFRTCAWPEERDSAGALHAFSRGPHACPRAHIWWLKCWVLGFVCLSCERDANGALHASSRVPYAWLWCASPSCPDAGHSQVQVVSALRLGSLPWGPGRTCALHPEMWCTALRAVWRLSQLQPLMQDQDVLKLATVRSRGSSIRVPFLCLTWEMKCRWQTAWRLPWLRPAPSCGIERCLKLPVPWGVPPCSPPAASPHPRSVPSRHCSTSKYCISKPHSAPLCRYST